MPFHVLRWASMAIAIHLSATALAEVASRPAFSVCIEMAERIAAEMPPGEKSDLSFLRIALAYARHGDFHQIERVVSFIREDQLRASAILETLRYSKVGQQDRDAAIALAQRAKEIATMLPQGYARDNLYWRIAGQQALNGTVDQAFETGRLIESLPWYDQTLYQIAAAQVQNGDIPGATATAKGMRPGRWRNDAFAVIAGASPPGTDSSAGGALAESRDQKDSALWFMVADKVKAGDYESGLALAREIAITGPRGLAFRTVAEAAGAAGNLDVAREAFREARGSARRGYQLTELAISQAKANLFDEALATVDELQKLPRHQRSLFAGNDVVSALAQIAHAQRSAGRLEKARQTLVRALGAADNGSPYYGSDAMSIVIAAVAIGDVEMARGVAQRMRPERTDETYTAIGLKALGAIAAGLARSGDFDAAAEIIAELDGIRPHLNITDDTLREIAVEHVRHDRFDAALRTADRIHDPYMRVLALTEMATAAK